MYTVRRLVGAMYPFLKNMDRCFFQIGVGDIQCSASLSIKVLMVKGLVSSLNRFGCYSQSPHQAKIAFHIILN
jgi:hypothetical protein